MIRALIFDFDGTILDTESAEFETWQEVYRRYGQELPMKEWSLIVGSAGYTFDLLEHLEHLVGSPLPREEIRLERRRRDQAIVESLSPREGVVKLLHEAVAAGLGLAVASSSPRAWIEGHLARLDLLDLFQAIASYDETGRGKPDPATYLLALERLGVSPVEAVAIEDSPNGVMAAMAASIACLAVPNPVTARMTFPQGTRLQASLAGVSLQELAHLAGAVSAAD